MRVVESADTRGHQDTKNRYKVRPLYLSLPLSAPANKTTFQMRKKSDLKFSWDERQAGKHPEDWSVHKVIIRCLIFINQNSAVLQIKIDGFDPDKFKAANNQNLGSKSNIRTNNINNYNNNNNYNTTTTLG